ncbi:MAG TPA: phosphodiesterase [Pseudolabrys sp.]|nr:phosphodiesterase [Pseudolabrys sp.]
MSARPVVIAQITDLHIKPPGSLAYGRVDTAAALSRCIMALNRLAPRPDLVVISGDLTDIPDAVSYDHVRALLSSLLLPFIAVPGNHDHRALLRAALPHQDEARATGPVNVMRAVHGLDVIALDSSVPGKPHGELDATTLRWLDATLGASTTRPAILFLHHPPFITGIGHMDVQNLRNAADLAILLRRHKRARLVAAGHVHRATVTTFADIAATICPAPNHAVALDLEARLPPSYKVEPPAYHLHVWFPGDGFGSVVTHLVPIGEFDGPHPFFDTGGRLLR